MHPEKITVTRQRLYQQVWSIPMQKLAKEFGLSDVSLAKLCRRHRVFVPGRGYWARLAAGQKARRLPLPTSQDPRFDTIEIQPSERQAMEGEAMEERQPILSIEVAEDRPVTHPLALQVERAIPRSTVERGVLLVLDESLEFSISEVVKVKPHTLRPQERDHSWTAPDGIASPLAASDSQSTAT